MSREEDTKKLRKIMEHLLVGKKLKMQKISWEQLQKGIKEGEE